MFTFAVPYRRFEEMEANVEESFLKRGLGEGGDRYWSHQEQDRSREELSGELTHLFPVFVLVGPEVFIHLYHAFEEFPSLFVNSLLIRGDLLGSYCFDELLTKGESLLFSSFYLAWDIW